MGARCSSTDPNIQKIINLKRTYSKFHLEAASEEDNIENEVDIVRNNVIKLIDHRKTFEKYRDEIQITNKELYHALFIKEYKEKDVLEVKNIKSIDEPKLMFFLNKSEFKKVKISNSALNFPHV